MALGIKGDIGFRPYLLFYSLLVILIGNVQKEIENARAKGDTPICTFSPRVWTIGTPMPQIVPKRAPESTSVIKWLPLIILNRAVAVARE